VPTTHSLFPSGDEGIAGDNEDGEAFPSPPSFFSLTLPLSSEVAIVCRDVGVVSFPPFPSEQGNRSPPLSFLSPSLCSPHPTTGKVDVFSLSLPSTSIAGWGVRTVEGFSFPLPFPCHSFLRFFLWTALGQGRAINRHHSLFLPFSRGWMYWERIYSFFFLSFFPFFSPVTPPRKRATRGKADARICFSCPLRETRLKISLPLPCRMSSFSPHAYKNPASTFAFFFCPVPMLRNYSGMKKEGCFSLSLSFFFLFCGYFPNSTGVGKSKTTKPRLLSSGAKKG